MNKSLFGKKNVTWQDPYVAPSLYRSKSKKKAAEPVTPDDVKSKVEEAIRQTQENIKIIDSRGSGIFYEFSYDKNPEVADAVDMLFDGAKNIISYEMYKTALGYAIKILKNKVSDSSTVGDIVDW